MSERGWLHAELKAKIFAARFWLVFWTASFSFWTYHLVTDPDWLTSAMWPLTGILWMSSIIGLRRLERLRDHVEATLEASKRRSRL